MIQNMIQIVTGMLGSIGFAVMFHVQKEKLPAIAMGSAISWVVYLAVWKLSGEKTAAFFIATVAVTFLAEILARVLKAPATILLVPMLVPLIPGSDLYYATNNLVNGNVEACAASTESLLKSAGAIAFGIISVTCLFQVITVRKRAAAPDR